MKYEGEFTMDDAENDGLIKRHVGKQMASNLMRQAPQMYDYLEAVAQEKGQEPWEVLGDHVVRALNNEDHAGRISAVDIDMSKLKSNQLRIEDAKFIKEFSQELGIDEGEDEGDWVEDMVMDRVKAKNESPIPRLNNGKSQKDVDPEVRQELDQMKKEMRQLTDALQNQAEDVESVGEDDETVDDIFGEEEEGDEVVEVGEVDEGQDENPVEEEASVSGGGDEGGDSISGSFSMDTLESTEAEDENIPSSEDGVEDEQ